jgi:ribosome-associated translation inhibitor RaiA
MMNIEFDTNYGKVPEKLVSEIRDKILNLAHINKDISRAEVVLKEDETIISAENKVCEIRLTVYGDNLFSHSRTENFNKSAKEAMKELKKLVKQQVKKQQEPPDEITSTVDV